MAQCLTDHLAEGADLICWAPLSKQRFRQRGFNQAELMAREMGRLLSVPAEPVLMKVKDTGPQSDLEEESARRANARGAYALLPGVGLTGKRVVPPSVSAPPCCGRAVRNRCSVLPWPGQEETGMLRKKRRKLLEKTVEKRLTTVYNTNWYFRAALIETDEK